MASAGVLTSVAASHVTVSALEPRAVTLLQPAKAGGDVSAPRTAETVTSLASVLPAASTARTANRHAAPAGPTPVTCASVFPSATISGAPKSTISRPPKTA